MRGLLLVSAVVFLWCVVLNAIFPGLAYVREIGTTAAVLTIASVVVFLASGDDGPDGDGWRAAT